jgi:hypothetical protein
MPHTRIAVGLAWSPWCNQQGSGGLAALLQQLHLASSWLFCV